MPGIALEGRTLETDQLGYLLDPADWDRDVAEVIARAEGIDMTPDHWEVITLVREHYESRQAVPELRILFRSMRERMDPSLATRKSLHRLFPYGYGPQVCKIAGMTMPRKVMLDV